jgi:hypothetical protein
MKTTYATGPGVLVLALMLSGPSGQTLAADYGSGAQGAHPSFSQLDIDGNGVLSAAEAAGTSGLLDDWTQADRNSDNAIERSEFAAFEAQGPMSSLPPAPRAVMPGPGVAGTYDPNVLDYRHRGEFLFQ